MRDNLPEAQRYYELALNVIRNCVEVMMPEQTGNTGNEASELKALLADQAKIHVSIA
jgi:hypothetical protein